MATRSSGRTTNTTKAVRFCWGAFGNHPTKKKRRARRLIPTPTAHHQCWRNLRVASKLNTTKRFTNTQYKIHLKARACLRYASSRDDASVTWNGVNRANNKKREVRRLIPTATAHHQCWRNLPATSKLNATKKIIISRVRRIAATFSREALVFRYFVRNDFRSEPVAHRAGRNLCARIKLIAHYDPTRQRRLRVCLCSKPKLIMTRHLFVTSNGIMQDVASKRPLSFPVLILALSLALRFPSRVALPRRHVPARRVLEFLIQIGQWLDSF